jgi:hypothetical protein
MFDDLVGPPVSNEGLRSGLLGEELALLRCIKKVYAQFVLSGCMGFPHQPVEVDIDLLFFDILTQCGFGEKAFLCEFFGSRTAGDLIGRLHEGIPVASVGYVVGPGEVEHG